MNFNINSIGLASPLVLKQYSLIYFCAFLITPPMCSKEPLWSLLLTPSLIPIDGTGAI
ncbi:hypothetical protein P692DRAFT_201599096 [Suillus brevipes Sb2]|nr:hypothetical protein P692DRAFT_201599096 [Suillus brevipes Sb2]